MGEEETGYSSPPHPPTPPQPRQQYPTAIIEKEIGTKRHQKCSWELDIGSPRDRVLRVVGITQSWGVGLMVRS